MSTLEVSGTRLDLWSSGIDRHSRIRVFEFHTSFLGHSVVSPSLWLFLCNFDVSMEVERRANGSLLSLLSPPTCGPLQPIGDIPASYRLAYRRFSHQPFKCRAAQWLYKNNRLVPATVIAQAPTSSTHHRLFLAHWRSRRHGELSAYHNTTLTQVNTKLTEHEPADPTKQAQTNHKRRLRLRPRYSHHLRPCLHKELERPHHQLHPQIPHI